jgi:hypothetical protein
LQSIISFPRHMFKLNIDGHIFWNSKRWFLFIVCWPEKTNFYVPLSICSKQTKVTIFRIYTSISTSVYPYLYIYIYNYISASIYYIYDTISIVKWKMEAQAIFPNLFAVCSLCKRKFVVCPFVFENTSGLNGLAYLCN